MTVPASSVSPLAHEGRLAHFPVALFSTVMGMAGLAIAWLKAHHDGSVPLDIGLALRWLASGLYVFLLAIYAAKALRHPDAVRSDWGHPVRLNFFPAISIGLILLGIAWAQDAPGAARWLWGIGAAAHLTFTLLAMSSWIHHAHYDIRHANPAWFIPVVGNILVPIAGVRFAPLDVSWFFFSIGLVFWLVLKTIVLYRLFFHEALPARLTPTLFILIAPPAVGFISYVALTGQLDAFARVLYFTALFLTLLLASNAVRFFRLPFFISAWAYSFPLAAMTIATFEMSARSGSAFYAGLSWGLLAILSAVVALLALKTLAAAAGHRICVPE
ncbi:SLAC1 anion channel family protein [Thauera linaloolentis]|uniref:Tellurite resistance protein-like permease n=1 Tax=Thauera linaloolentis (strain DSM 12138 / JCM 21573 / CCUG 41526 / CIP 105981 / IAM 15112 / NBRC 102519 / 47Lol) TaxID=1123367 RepID=N6Y7G6_THAL4|nr:SLAC1 anion channel family protein [Thauera linaloolentis]ENO90231.1 tellurite resistance protein-like permease [Thauera linaloolentis 47Lol = DSM 12138]MCM8566278.1 SLAC1 anion channel family protein [Thauera linaloolentis]